MEVPRKTLTKLAALLKVGTEILISKEDPSSDEVTKCVTAIVEAKNIVLTIFRNEKLKQVNKFEDTLTEEQKEEFRKIKLRADIDNI